MEHVFDLQSPVRLASSYLTRTAISRTDPFNVYITEEIPNKLPSHEAKG